MEKHKLRRRPSSCAGAVRRAHSKHTGSHEFPHRNAGHDGSMAGMGTIPSRADGTPVRILVVDDEPTLTELLSMALRL